MKHSPWGRTHMLAVRMDAEELAAAQRMAQTYGVSLADLARLMLTTGGFCDRIIADPRNVWLAGLPHLGIDAAALERTLAILQQEVAHLTRAKQLLATRKQALTAGASQLMPAW
jgi:hypothetical protein